MWIVSVVRLHFIMLHNLTYFVIFFSWDLWICATRVFSEGWSWDFLNPSPMSSLALQRHKLGIVWESCCREVNVPTCNADSGASHVEASYPHFWSQVIWGLDPNCKNGTALAPLPPDTCGHLPSLADTETSEPCSLAGTCLQRILTRATVLVAT